MRGWVIGAIAWAVAVGGCIESQRATLPPSDSAGPGGDGSDTASEDADGGGDGASAADTREPDCIRPSDCDAIGLPPCKVAACHEGQCRAVPGREGQTCNDGDACTTSGVCADGVCAGSAPVACPATSTPCSKAECDPQVGCVEGAADDGTLCDNGTGAPPGTCTEEGWALADSCDAGACVDRFDAGGVVVGPQSPEGAWYFVASSMGGSQGTRVTARGWMGLEGQRAVTMTGVTTSATSSSTGSPWVAGTGVHAGWFCSTNTGRVDLALSGPTAFSGQVTPNAGHMASVSPDARTLLVAVRPHGTAASVHGAYRLAATSIPPESGMLRSWVGSLSFDLGCVKGAGSLMTRPGGDTAPSWVVQGRDGGCVAEDAEQNAPYALELEMRPEGSTASWTRIRWAGAIAAGGDVIVLTHDDGDDAPRYGTLVMVRESVLGTNTSLATSVFAYHFQGSHGEGMAIGSERGAFAVGAFGAVSGWVQAPPPQGLLELDGDIAARTASGRYGHVLRTGSLSRTQSGWINPTNTFGFVFTASVATSELDELANNVPQHPSLGFVVRVLGASVPEP